MKLLIIIVLLLVTINSYACSCGHVGILKNKKSVNYVFKGRVKEIKKINTQDTATGTNEVVEYIQLKYTFEIINNYKGLNDKKTIDLFSGMTDCEVSFDKNKTYIVYAYNYNKKLHYRLSDQNTEPYATTHLCTRTKRESVLTLWEYFVLWLT